MGLGKCHPTLCGVGFTLGDEQGGLCFAEWHGDIAFQAHLGDIELGVGHLTGDRTLPNQLVQCLLFAIFATGAFRRMGGPDGFVGTLGAFLGFPGIGSDRCR